MWATIIELNDKNLKVCEDIAKKDKTFIFVKKEGKIIIYSETIDQAWKRGYWLKHKANAKSFSILKVK